MRKLVSRNASFWQKLDDARSVHILELGHWAIERIGARDDDVLVRWGVGCGRIWWGLGLVQADNIGKYKG